jgi:hypothetical protein
MSLGGDLEAALTGNTQSADWDDADADGGSATE